MRTIWIREVRYYKYIICLCILLIICGCVLLNEYKKDENNIGSIINIQYIYNISYVIPIYKVKTSNQIYNVYDYCVIDNITKCNITRRKEEIINIMVYFTRINGIYILAERNHFPLYFSAFAFTFSVLVSMIISYAYFDFNRFRKNEYNKWSKKKKYDIDFVEENASLLYD
jgi:hypothetical protein